MKIVPLIFLFISPVIYAEENCEIETFGDQVSKHFAGECPKVSNNIMAHTGLMRKKGRPACQECNEIIGETRKNSKKFFMELATDSLRKHLSDTAVNLMKMRSVIDKSINIPTMSCDLEKISTGPCAKIPELKYEIGVIQSELANDIAVMIDQKRDKAGCLLVRIDNHPGCDVSDAQALYVQAKAAEQFFFNTFGSKLSKLELGPKGTISDFLGWTAEQKANIKLNPMLNFVLNDKEASKLFLNSLKENKSASFSQILNSSVLVEKYTESIERSCNKAIEAFHSVCSDPRLSEGHVYSDSLNQLFNPSIEKKPEEIKNRTRSWCFENQNQEGALQFTEFEKKFVNMEGEAAQIQHFQTKRQHAHALYFNNIKGNLCENRCSDTNKSGIECIELDIWKKMQQSGTEEYKQSRESNNNINHLLASMIGTSPFIATQTRDFLVSSNIVIMTREKSDDTDSIIRKTDVSGPGNRTVNSVNGGGRENIKTVINANKEFQETNPPGNPYYQSNASTLPLNDRFPSSQNLSHSEEDEQRPGSTKDINEAIKDPFNRRLLDKLLKSKKDKFTESEVRENFKKRHSEKYTQSPTFSEDINRMSDRFYDQAYNSVEQKFGAAGEMDQTSTAANVRRLRKSPLTKEDRVIINSLIDKYQSDVKNKEDVKSDQPGQQDSLIINTEGKDLRSKLEEVKLSIIAKDDHKFLLQIDKYEFEVIDRVPYPKGNVPKEIVDHVRAFFSEKLPPLKKRRLKYLKEILTAHSDS